MTEAQTADYWEGLARQDIRDAQMPVTYRKVYRSPLGRLAHATFQGRLVAYAEEDPSLPVLLSMLPRGGKRILDIGIRTGSHAKHCAVDGNSVFGIDFVQAYVDYCLRKRHVSFARRVDVTAEEIPTPRDFGESDASHYDCVFACEILEHLLDTAGFLRKIARVLAPGGTLILSTPNLAYVWNRLRLLLGRQLDPHTIDIALTNQHIRVFTRNALRHLLAQAGFAVERVASETVYSCRVPGVATEAREEGGRTTLLENRVSMRWLARAMPTLGRTLFLRCRRTDAGAA